MFRLRLKTKLVMAITFMVVALVTTLLSIFISQLIKQRIEETAQNADFVAAEVFQSAREALEADLATEHGDLKDDNIFEAAVAQSLGTDAGVTSLLQSIVGYSPTIYDVGIVDVHGRAIVHSDANLVSKDFPQRESFDQPRYGGFLKQVRAVFGAPRVYDVQLPLLRDDRPFATVHVGISSVFLKSEIQPKLNKALLLSSFCILFSIILAVVVSTFAFRPLEAISRKLDEMSAGTVVPALPPVADSGRDEYGVVNTKIDRLGKQMRDVKEVFSALQENLDQIMTNLQDGVMLFTRENNAVLVSSSIETFLHKPQADLMGRNASEIFDADSALGATILAAFRDHRPIQQLEIAIPPTKEKDAVRIQLSLDLIEENGERIGALLTLRDAESVHRIEDQLELSRRMAAVGRLTSGVAHEVKNPINAIVVHLEVMRQKIKQPDPDTIRHMDVISSEIRRLDRVVQTLVDFTRPMELRLVETDLRTLLDEVINLASPDAEKHGVHVMRKLSETPILVVLDADLVKQAVLNIMINGMQAMPQGGNLTVAARRTNNEAQVEISDQGGGIPTNIRDKIFNLYFTTKSGGSGIGLPMSYRVVQLHNGSMEFDSMEGEGTTFRLNFPLSEAPRNNSMNMLANPRGTHTQSQSNPTSSDKVEL